MCHLYVVVMHFADVGWILTVSSSLVLGVVAEGSKQSPGINTSTVQ